MLKRWKQSSEKCYWECISHTEYEILLGKYLKYIVKYIISNTMHRQNCRLSDDNPHFSFTPWNEEYLILLPVCRKFRLQVLFAQLSEPLCLWYLYMNRFLSLALFWILKCKAHLILIENVFNQNIILPKSVWIFCNANIHTAFNYFGELFTANNY